MAEHPIQGLMRTALESLKEMVDVNTVIGDPVETREGQVIIPVSRVSFGFAAGGTEFVSGRGGGGGGGGSQYEDENSGGGQNSFPFGGGSGAGVSVQPVGFLVVGKESLRMLPVNSIGPMEKLIDVAPQLLERLAGTRAGGGKGGHGEGGGERQGQKRQEEPVGSAPARRDRADRLARRLTQKLGQSGGRESNRMGRS